MFDFFRKKGESKGQGSAAEAVLAGIRATIAAKKKEDPLIAPKIAAEEINNHLIAGLKNEKGVHFESYLTALGALAGFSCQMSVRNMPGSIKLNVAEGKDGKKYYFGDPLNKPLAEGTYSVWSLAAGGVQQLGETPPDVNSIFQHVAATVGSGSFGVPRIPEDHRPGDSPLNYLKVIWPRLFPVARQICELPEEWPILFGIAIQRGIVMGKDVLNPALAASIAMESAIPMSKVDLPEFYS